MYLGCIWHYISVHGMSLTVQQYTWVVYGGTLVYLGCIWLYISVPGIYLAMHQCSLAVSGCTSAYLGCSCLRRVCVGSSLSSLQARQVQLKPQEA